MDQYKEAMARALFLANKAREMGDVPVGAVVIDSLGRIIGRGWNCREALHDPCGHAEIMALRGGGERLDDPQKSGGSSKKKSPSMTHTARQGTGRSTAPDRNRRLSYMKPPQGRWKRRALRSSRTSPRCNRNMKPSKRRKKPFTPTMGSWKRKSGNTI